MSLPAPAATAADSTFQACPLPMLVVDAASGVVVDANDAAASLYGEPAEALRGRAFVGLWAPGQAPGLAALRQRVDVDAPDAAPEKHLDASGAALRVRLTLRSLAGAGGERWLAALDDVTDRLIAERAERRSERVYRALIENSFDGVAVLGPDLSPRPVADVAARALGAEAEPAAERGRRELLHPADRGVFAEAVARLAGRPGERETVTYRARDADGRWHWYEGALTNLADDPDVGAHVLHFHDVTARVRAADEVARLNSQLERRLRHLQALRRIDMAITNAIDVALALDIFLEQVQADLDVEAAGVLLVDADGETLRPTAMRGFSAPMASAPVRLGAGLAGYAAQEQRTVHVSDMRADGRAGAIVDARAQDGVVAYWAVPMLTKGRLQGVIELYARRSLVPDAEWFEFLETFADQGAIAVESALLFRSLERSNVELQSAYDRTIEGWAYALDLKDEETAGHSKRVTRLTVRMAQRLGMDAKEILHVQRGALLHDIGKMGVPDSILLKRGPLTRKQREEMERHPVYAMELLSPIEFLRPAIAIPYAHHEKWDGSGYPRGLKGEEIPLPARIFAIVDVYDALISDRPYRVAWDRERTLAHIAEQSGSHFDPALVEAFLEMIRAEG